MWNFNVVGSCKNFTHSNSFPSKSLTYLPLTDPFGWANPLPIIFLLSWESGLNETASAGSRTERRRPGCAASGELRRADDGSLPLADTELTWPADGTDRQSLAPYRFI